MEMSYQLVNLFWRKECFRFRRKCTKQAGLVQSTNITFTKQNTEIEMALQVLSADRDLTRKVSYYLYTFDIQPRKKGRRMDKTVCMLHIWITTWDLYLYL